MYARLLALLAFYMAVVVQATQLHYNTTRSLVARDGTTCEAGKIYCEQFGCLSTTTCPEACTNRKDRTSCNYSVDGHGCRWESEACIVDVQCLVNHDGSCPTNCVGCGAFQCINVGLSCPLPCAARKQTECDTPMALYNGVGCKWSNGQCAPWNMVENSALAETFVVATQDFVTGSATAALESIATSSGVPTATPTSSVSVEEKSSMETSSDVSLSSSDEPEQENSTDEQMSGLGSDSEEEEAESSASSSASSSAGNSAVFEGANTAVASKSSGLGAGPIVGIVIGSAAIIGLISWIILYQVTKNKRGLSSANYLDIDKHGPGQDPYGSKVDLITTAAELAHMGRR